MTPERMAATERPGRTELVPVPVDTCHIKYYIRYQICNRGLYFFAGGDDIIYWSRNRSVINI